MTNAHWQHDYFVQIRGATETHADHTGEALGRAPRADRRAYDDKLQAFVDFVLSQYVQEGVGELDDAKLPDLLEIKYHSVHDASADARRRRPRPRRLHRLPATFT